MVMESQTELHRAVHVHICDLADELSTICISPKTKGSGNKVLGTPEINE